MSLECQKQKKTKKNCLLIISWCLDPQFRLFIPHRWMSYTYIIHSTIQVCLLFQIENKIEPDFRNKVVTEGKKKKKRYNLLHNVGDCSGGRRWDGLYHHWSLCCSLWLSHMLEQGPLGLGRLLGLGVMADWKQRRWWCFSRNHHSNYKQWSF